MYNHRRSRNSPYASPPVTRNARFNTYQQPQEIYHHPPPDYGPEYQQQHESTTTRNYLSNVSPYPPNQRVYQQNIANNYPTNQPNNYAIYDRENYMDMIEFAASVAAKSAAIAINSYETNRYIHHSHKHKQPLQNIHEKSLQAKQIEKRTCINDIELNPSKTPLLTYVALERFQPLEIEFDGDNAVLCYKTSHGQVIYVKVSEIGKLDVESWRLTPMYNQSEITCLFNTQNVNMGGRNTIRQFIWKFQEKLKKALKKATTVPTGTEHPTHTTSINSPQAAVSPRIDTAIQPKTRSPHVLMNNDPTFNNRSSSQEFHFPSYPSNLFSDDSPEPSDTEQEDITFLQHKNTETQKKRKTRRRIKNQTKKKNKNAQRSQQKFIEAKELLQKETDKLKYNDEFVKSNWRKICGRKKIHLVEQWQEICKSLNSAECRKNGKNWYYHHNGRGGYSLQWKRLRNVRKRDITSLGAGVKQSQAKRQKLDVDNDSKDEEDMDDEVTDAETANVDVDLTENTNNRNIDTVVANASADLSSSDEAPKNLPATEIGTENMDKDATGNVSIGNKDGPTESTDGDNTEINIDQNGSNHSQ